MSYTYTKYYIIVLPVSLTISFDIINTLIV